LFKTTSISAFSGQECISARYYLLEKTVSKKQGKKRTISPEIFEMIEVQM